eukprot:m.18283 g.18283  ORF g.18283 m.18283 type:complete len:378 (+) comp6265_c0_seq2:222-1355(+)
METAESALATPSTSDGKYPVDMTAINKCIHDFKEELTPRGGVIKLGTYEIAKRAAETIRQIISSKRAYTAAEMMRLLKHADQGMQSGLPSDAIVSNMVRRVLRLIREAYTTCLNEETRQGAQPISSVASLADLLMATDAPIEFNYPFKGFKPKLIQAINDLIEEVEESAHNIAIQALEHIHSAEVIMTAGYSRTVESFLKKAAAKRSFHVIVAESAPSYQGQDLAVSLGRAGIETTLITDSAVFAVMSRVNKVIIGTNMVMADGGLMALNGSHALALAAKHHSVPVVVCAAMFKLCPKYLCSYDNDDFNYMSNPSSILDYADASVHSKVSTHFPLFDYVPPNLVSLYVTNIGCHAPSYIYRMLNEYYHEDDDDKLME